MVVATVFQITHLLIATHFCKEVIKWFIIFLFAGGVKIGRMIEMIEKLGLNFFYVGSTHWVQ